MLLLFHPPLLQQSFCHMPKNLLYIICGRARYIECKIGYDPHIIQFMRYNLINLP
jgi:hypothetical protein